LLITIVTNLDTNLQNKILLVTKIVIIMNKSLELIVKFVTDSLETNLEINSFDIKKIGS